MRVGEVIHLTHDDLMLDGPTPVAHIRAKEVVPGEKPWRPKNGEERAVPLSPRAVSMLRSLPRRRRWVIDRMNGTKATATKPANDRHILAYLKTVLAKLGLEGTNHKFRHSFCTIAVLAGVDFFTLRRWVGGNQESGGIVVPPPYPTITPPPDSRPGLLSMEEGSAGGLASNGEGGIRSIALVRIPPSHPNSAGGRASNGEGGIRTRGPAFDRTRL